MTAVELLGISFLQWEKDWQNFEKTGTNRPLPYDDFMKPFLEIEKQQIIDAHLDGQSFLSFKDEHAQQYYNETFKK